MKPISAYYCKEIKKWLRDNSPSKLTTKEVLILSRETFKVAVTPVNIISGSKISGMWPLNLKIFDDDDFEPADLTCSNRKATARIEF